MESKRFFDNAGESENKKSEDVRHVDGVPRSKLQRTDGTPGERQGMVAEAPPIPYHTNTQKQLDAELMATQVYLNEIGFVPSLAVEEENYFARRAQLDCEASQRRLIESNRRLVVKIAGQYMDHGLVYLELVEGGYLGLVKAVDQFHPELNVRFSTYATRWIREGIEQAIASRLEMKHILASFLPRRP